MTREEWEAERANKCCECRAYGADYYYDEGIGENIKVCDFCPWNEDWEGE